MKSLLKTNSHRTSPIVFFGIIDGGTEAHDSVGIDNNNYIDIQIAI